METKPADPLRQHILEAVDCLRQRKCRPDRESICHQILRKHGSTMNEIFAELENIVDDGGLLKVEYKGTTSYRSPSSFDTKNSPLLTKHSKILNSSKTTRLIITGINEMLAKDSNFAQIGVPLEELKAKLYEFDVPRFTAENIDVLLEREINIGSITIAKCNLLEETLRVFPKDISVPIDMKVISLGVDPPAEIKEEKKPRKPRKSAAPSNPTDESENPTEPKKARKSTKSKEEPTANNDDDPSPATEEDSVFAVKSTPSELAIAFTEAADEQSSPTAGTGKKTPRSAAAAAAAGRRIIAEKVAQVIRKNYESTTAFESTSIQMIKLAQNVVNRQPDDPKGPTLVLAGSDANGDSDGLVIDEASDGSSPSKVQKSPVKKAVTADSPAGSTTRKSRTSAKLETESSKDTSETETKDETSSPAEGLTRSKRDKRKKQVFDPSDLPNTYSKYASPQSASKRPRSEESPQGKQASPKGAATSISKNTPAIASTKEKLEDISKKVLGKKVPFKKSLPPSKTSNSQIKQDLSPSAETESEKTQALAGKGKKSDMKNGSTEKSSNSVKSIKLIKKETCDNCSKDSKGKIEEILTCSACSTTGHPSCIGYSSEMSQRLLEFIGDSKRKFNWHCSNCKTCGVCNEKTTPHKNGSSESNEKGETSDPLICGHCDAGFHSACIKDDAISKKTEDWICKDCISTDVNEGSKTATDDTNDDGGRALRNTPKSTKQPVVVKTEPIKNLKQRKQEAAKSTEEQPDADDEEEDDSPIDIRSWSTSDVEKYFISKSLKEEAASLRQQEVDGCSLLLLQREDIINGMGFRLGPALKVFRYIFELQSRATVKPKVLKVRPNEKTTKAQSPISQPQR